MIFNSVFAIKCPYCGSIDNADDITDIWDTDYVDNRDDAIVQEVSVACPYCHKRYRALVQSKIVPVSGEPIEEEVV